MLDITQLNNFDINSEKALSETKEKVADIMLHYEIKEARILYNFLNKKLAENKNIYLENEYSKILKQLRFLDLDILSDNEIIGLYQNDFGKILEYYEDYNPFGVLRLKLLNLPLRDRDEFKKRVVLALLSNKEIITKYAMFFVEGGKSEPPSITNWIRDYTRIAEGGVFTNIAKANYFTNSKNYLALSEEEKQKVKVLLSFYFRLQLSSLTPQGLENDLVFTDKDGKTKILSEGKIIDTSADTVANIMSIRKRDLKIKNEKEIANEVSDVKTEAEKELINILEEEINKDTNGDFEQLILMLNQNINIGSREEIEAILQILRKQGKINDLQKIPELLEDLEEMDFLNEFKTEVNNNLSAHLSNTQIVQKDIKQLMQEVLIGDREEEKKIKKLESEIKDKEESDVEKIISGLKKCLTPQPLPNRVEDRLLSGGEIENKTPQPPFAKGGNVEPSPSPSAGGGKIEEVAARLRLLAKIDTRSLARLLVSGETSLTPSNFQELIKNILGEKFGLPETETARYGMQLAIILKNQHKPEFMKTVYFDKKERTFKWNTV